MQAPGKGACTSFMRLTIQLENQLCEVVETVFPNDEVVLAVREFDECTGDSVFIAERLEAGTVVHKAVLAAADHPEEFVLRLGLLHVGNENLRRIGIRS